MLRKYIYLAFIFLLFYSCKNKTIKYYETGKKKSEYIIIDGKKEGIYKEFYPSGNLRVIHNYRNNVLVDSSMYYYRGNTKIKFIRFWNRDNKIYERNYDTIGNTISEGYLSKDLNRIEKWKKHDAESLLESIHEYIIVDGKQYLNQYWGLNSKNDTLFYKSNFFKITLSKDTITKETPYKGVLYLDAPFFKGKNSEVEMFFYKDNDIGFTDEKKEVTTFYNLSNDKKNEKWFPGSDKKRTVAFGGWLDKLGANTLKGFILEKYNNKLEGKTENRKLYFEFSVYVIDSNFPRLR